MKVLTSLRYLQFVRTTFSASSSPSVKPDVCGKQKPQRWVDDDYYQDDQNQFGDGVGMVTSKEELLHLLLQTTTFGAGDAHGTLKGKIGSLGGQSEETMTMSDATVCWGLLGSVF